MGGAVAVPARILRCPTLPFKADAACRHRIPRQRHRVTNPAAYDAVLRQRGSLTVWFTDATIAAGPRTTRGGQARTLPLVIATALTLRAVFRMALCQTEGLIGSILALHGRRRWRGASGCHWRAFAETDISWFKHVIGNGLRSRTDRRRGTEIALAVAVLSQTLELGRPEYARLM